MFFVAFVCNSCTESKTDIALLVLGPVTPTPSGSLIEMQTIQPQPRPMKSKSAFYMHTKFAKPLPIGFNVIQRQRKNISSLKICHYITLGKVTTKTWPSSDPKQRLGNGSHHSTILLARKTTTRRIYEFVTSLSAAAGFL